LDKVIMKMRAISASVASRAAALTQSARQGRGPPSSAASIASSDMAEA
jgi:hypothetical protein